jgi:Carbamoyl-phosphate synthase small chain, CPSase domain
VLVLEDGTVFRGRGLGAFGQTLGEVCFNTSMTGYQEILSDQSYAGQIITFTFPHIGNVGTNHEDIESRPPACRGLVQREDISPPANWRARGCMDRSRSTSVGARGRHVASSAICPSRQVKGPDHGLCEVIFYEAPRRVPCCRALPRGSASSRNAASSAPMSAFTEHGSSLSPD